MNFFFNISANAQVIICLLKKNVKTLLQCSHRELVKLVTTVASGRTLILLNYSTFGQKTEKVTKPGR